MRYAHPLAHYHRPNLSHLVRLGLATILLQVDELLSPLFAKRVVAAFDALFKPQMKQQLAQISEGNTGIGRSAQNFSNSFS
jgi:hypothetical protein